LIERLSKGRDVRRKFVESQIPNEISFQLRAMRHEKHWSQPTFAKELGTTQNQIYRLENPAKSKPTISTLKKVAALFDVALVVRFVPFSEVIDYLTGTPRRDSGLSTTRKRPLGFAEELPMLEASLMPKQPLTVPHEKNAPSAKAEEGHATPRGGVIEMQKAMGQTNSQSDQIRPPQRFSPDTGDGAAAACGSRGN
jgi:transcriptional regulator with XRE-family HTH domain